LDASEIDRKALDKVNEILSKIEKETNPNNLPSDAEINSYGKSQVPSSKSHDQVKKLRNNKKIQLEQDTVDQKARSAAIQSINN